jgi:hypothetical protein
MKSKLSFWGFLLIAVGGMVMASMAGCENGTTQDNDTLIGIWQSEENGDVEFTFVNNGTVYWKQISSNIQGEGIFIDKKTEVIITYIKISMDGGSTWQTLTEEQAEPQTASYSFLDGKLILGDITYIRKG